MSALLATLKNHALSTRKAHHVVGTAVLTTMIGELESKAKSANGKPTTDADVIALARKSLEAIREVIRLTEEKNDENVEATVAAFEAEIPFYENYIPTQLTDAETLEIVKTILESEPDITLGKVQLYFKTTHAGQYAGSLVNRFYVQLQLK